MINNEEQIKETTVAIIGAGVCGLTLATFLQHVGIACIVLERRDRGYIETRQRAGVVDARAVKMFEQWGLAGKLLAGPVAETIEYRLNGTPHIFSTLTKDCIQGRFCTQQMLVNNLMKELIDNMSGEVHFDVTDIAIENEENGRPEINYTTASGRQQLACKYIIGCDADRGVSRASIPEGILTKYSHEFGYAWLGALVQSPIKENPIMAVSEHGFVGQLPRGPQRSRYYLQCALNDSMWIGPTIGSGMKYA